MQVSRVDYRDSSDQQALVGLLNAYAMDPLGGAEALPEAVRNELCQRLADQPGACSWIVWHDQQPVGLLNAFGGFSTFKARPLINIHDVYVVPAARGAGVLELLFAAVEEEARQRGCCKLTLEVLEHNVRARNAYQKLGFSGYQLNDAGGTALFWQKALS